VKALFLIALAIVVFGGGAYFTYEMFIHPKQALEAEKALPPPPPPPDPTVPEFEKVQAVAKAGKEREAREALSAFVERYPESTKADEAKDLLGTLNSAFFLSPKPAPEKGVYIVKPGNVITKVAANLKISPELLMRMNKLKKPGLQIGQKLYYAPADFSLVINRKRNKVVLLNQGRFFKQYPIRSWPPVPSKLAAGQKVPKQIGKVRNKIAWADEKQMTISDPAYWDENTKFWIEINIAGATLYGELDPNTPPTPHSKPPNGGIGLDQESVNELAAFLSKDDAVTLE
jgi:LysM repeat protein